MYIIYFHLTVVLQVKFFLSLTRIPEAVKETSGKCNHAQVDFCGEKDTTDRVKGDKPKTNICHVYNKESFSVIRSAPLNQ